MPSYTLLRQDDDVRKSGVYDDTITPSLANFETNPTDLEYDLNAIRSQLHNLLKNYGGNWWDDLLTPSTFESGSERGVNNLNQDLHDFERKRVLRTVYLLTDITVPATQNYKVLTLGELPSNTTAAVGAVTTLGTVVAFHSGTFGTHSLDEVSGPNAITPKNLLVVVDGSTKDPVLDSSGRVIYALLQTETATDGHTMTGTTPVRAQVSFVVVNSTGDDLIACAVADIESKVVNYAYVERKAIQDLNEYDFLRGATVDVPSATSSVTRQNVYDNQGATPVNLTTNATLDLESPGIAWTVRDDLEAVLVKILEGSAGGTSEFQLGADVDVFNVDAVLNDFANGARFGTTGTAIKVNETAGVVERAADLIIRASGSGELYFDDSNQPGSWAQTAGIKLSDTATEWSDYETAFGGEVSLLRGIYMAYLNAQDPSRTWHEVTSNTGANSDVSGPSGAANVDVDFPDLSSGTFILNHWLFLNGRLMRPGANSGANYDYYPGTALTPDADLRFEKGIKNGDVIAVVTFPNT